QPVSPPVNNSQQLVRGRIRCSRLPVTPPHRTGTHTRHMVTRLPRGTDTLVERAHLPHCTGSLTTRSHDTHPQTRCTTQATAEMTAPTVVSPSRATNTHPA